MYPPVGREFRVKGGSHDTALAYEHGVAFPACQHFDSLSGRHNSWGANKDHFERSPGEAGFSCQNRGIDLAAISIAFHSGIENLETALCRVDDLARQQNGSRTRPEDRMMGTELFQRIKKMMLLEEFKHRGGFAAGKDETVEPGQLFSLAYLDRQRPCICQRISVRCIIALNGEDTDARGEVLCQVLSPVE